MTYKSRSVFDFLEWVFESILLPHPHLFAFLRHLMLHKQLFRIILEEYPDPSWIPQLADHAQVFAATHQRVRLATFGGGGNALGTEVGLLTTGNGHQSNSVNFSCISPQNQICKLLTSLELLMHTLS